VGVKSYQDILLSLRKLGVEADQSVYDQYYRKIRDNEDPDFTFRNLHRFIDKPWARKVIEDALRSEDVSRINETEPPFNFVLDNAELLQKYEWGKDLIRLHADEYPFSGIRYYKDYKGLDEAWAAKNLRSSVEWGIRNEPGMTTEMLRFFVDEPWAEEVVERLLETDEGSMELSQNMSIFFDKPWGKDIILRLIKETKYAFLVASYFSINEEMLAKPWAEEIAHALVEKAPRDLIRPGILKQPWAEPLIRRIAKESPYDIIWSYDPVLHRKPLSKPVISDLARYHPGKFLYAFDRYGWEAWMGDIVMEVVKRDPAMVAHYFPKFVNRPWAEKVARYLARRSPADIIHRMELLMQQPWGERVVKMAITSDPEHALYRVHFVAHEPWAAGILEQMRKIVRTLELIDPLKAAYFLKEYDLEPRKHPQDSVR